MHASILKRGQRALSGFLGLSRSFGTTRKSLFSLIDKYSAIAGGGSGQLHFDPQQFEVLKRLEKLNKALTIHENEILQRRTEWSIYTDAKAQSPTSPSTINPPPKTDRSDTSPTVAAASEPPGLALAEPSPIR